jgi:predicted Fe-S protein YdhL (DUF1289 family)
MPLLKAKRPAVTLHTACPYYSQSTTWRFSRIQWCLLLLCCGAGITIMLTRAHRPNTFHGRRVSRSGKHLFRTNTHTFQANIGNDDEETETISPPPEFAITPCNRICRYNANVYDGQICIGCFREAFEIQCWNSASPEDKYWMCLDAADRVVDGLDGSRTREELLSQAAAWQQRITDAPRSSK